MRQSFVAGLPFILFGCVVIAISSTYPVGLLQRMGPGFLPLVCGVLMVTFGALIAAYDGSDDSFSEPRTFLRPALAVFAGLTAWAMTVVPLGLVPATFLLVILVSYAQQSPSIVWSLVTASILSVFGTLVFIVGLNIRLTAFGF